MSRGEITGVVTGWAAALAVGYLGGWPLCAAVTLVSLVCLLELRWAAGRRRMRLSLEVGYAICVAYVFAAHWFADDLENYGVALLALTAFMVAVDFALHLHHGSGSPGANVSLTAFACLWCGLLLSCLILVRGLHPDLRAETVFGPAWPLGRRLFLYLVLTVGCSDLAATLGDALAGRRRLEQTVVPHRTVEGCLAAVVAAVAGSLLFGALFQLEATAAQGLAPAALGWLNLKHRLVLGLLLGLAARLGDFGAGIFRHDAEVERYEALSAGRAGLLDRLASLLLAAPVAYLYAQLAL